MINKSNSVIVAGFNTRPLAQSLNEAGYDVFAIDFFGDLDLFPSVKDFIIVMDELKSNYDSLKDKFSEFLAQFAIQLYHDHPDVKFFLIGSGLDDAYEERKLISDEIKNFDTISVNNDLEVIKKSRDIEWIYDLLKSNGFRIPIYYSFDKINLKGCNLEFPFILKKKRSAGGLNVYKIEKEAHLVSQVQILENKQFAPSEWLIQDYIKGKPVSCTVVSNGRECEIITFNEQVIGEKFLNSPKEFMYCGNIVPANLKAEEEKKISEISLFLTKKLNLRGINGFDFVIKDLYPYLMECNPRIPGSIRVSETALNLNLLDIHIKSFIPEEWEKIRNLIKKAKPRNVTTKFVFFAPKDIDKKLLPKLNRLEFIQDKPKPTGNILKGEPVCTILYGAKNSSKSLNGAKNIIKKIERIIN